MKCTAVAVEWTRLRACRIHKDTIVVCVLLPDGKTGLPARKTFRTFRNDLSRMRGWLKLLKVTEIAMESTGVYWRPVWNILEDHGFRLLLVTRRR
jgi:transposase